MITILKYRAAASSILVLLCGLSCLAADSDEKKTTLDKMLGWFFDFAEGK